MANFLDRVRDRMTSGFGRPSRPTRKQQRPEKTREVVVSNRWDERVWTQARQTKPIDDLIGDLYMGDHHKGGERPGFDMAPELVKGLWLSMYKAAPKLAEKRELTKDAYPVRKILEELLDNDKLRDLQRITANDATMSSVAMQAMGDSVREIIGRIPPPPPPGAKPQADPDAEPGEGQPQDGQPGSGQGQPQEGDGEPQPGGGSGGSPGGQQQPQGAKQDQDGDEPGDEPEGDDSDEHPDPDGEGQGGDEGQQQGEDDGEDDGDGDGDGQGEQPEGEHEAGDGDAEFDAESEAADREEADWQAAFDEILDDLDLERAVDKALNAAKDEASDLDNQRRGIGLDDGTWQTMSPEQRLAMAERLRTPEMKALADIVGRMRRFALGVRATRINDVPHEAYDVETGNDMRRLLRSEYALLATKETSYEFYRRYAERELLQYKMRGTEDAGKGPIVICVDKSGSMNGQPFNWALAVVEAMRRFAADDERDFTVLFFGSNNDRNRFDFPKGSGPFEKILAMLSVRANGGTQFDGVLTEALAIAVNAFDGEAKGKADIVFVTDGAAHLDEDWIKQFNAERERVGVRNFGVQIGTAYDYYGGGDAVLAKVTDAVVNVAEFKPEAVRDVFSHI